MTEVKMDPEIKAAWVRDLRSEEFEQGTGVLHRETPNGPEANGIRKTYCCLGVLCRRAAEAGVVNVTVSTSLDPSWRGIATYRDREPLGDASHHYLPSAVREWAGLPDSDPYVTINGVRERLSQHNDQGRSFAEIADAVDEQL